MMEPQRSLFDEITDNNLSVNYYYNPTPYTEDIPKEEYLSRVQSEMRDLLNRQRNIIPLMAGSGLELSNAQSKYTPLSIVGTATGLNQIPPKTLGTKWNPVERPGEWRDIYLAQPGMHLNFDPVLKPQLRADPDITKLSDDYKQILQTQSRDWLDRALPHEIFHGLFNTQEMPFLGEKAYDYFRNLPFLNTDPPLNDREYKRGMDRYMADMLYKIPREDIKKYDLGSVQRNLPLRSSAAAIGSYPQAYEEAAAYAFGDAMSRHGKLVQPEWIQDPKDWAIMRNYMLDRIPANLWDTVYPELKESNIGFE